MQIRLTVTFGPRGSGQGPGGAAGTAIEGGTAPVCDVVVTAPQGTPLSAVTGALVSTAASAGGASAGAAGAESSAESSAVVYAGTERLDPHRQMLGAPPLLDGAVVSLHAPAPDTVAPPLTAYGSAKARLHVVAGPDAGGIHLLQGGRVHLGRAAEADVPLDDPDVSRRHCAVTVSDSGAVTVTDLGSTNGTTLDGEPVGPQPVLFRPGSTLRVGESALRLAAPATGVELEQPGSPVSRSATAFPGPLPTEPDGDGRLRLTRGRQDGAADPQARPYRDSAVADPGAAGGSAPPPDSAHGYAPAGPVPGGGTPDGATTHGSGLAQHARHPGHVPPQDGPEPAAALQGEREERPRSRGLGAWARRFAGARGDEAPTPDASSPGAGSGAARSEAAADGRSETFSRPDPATVLLTSLGPGPRLWEREPGHPDALTVRLGTPHHSRRPGDSGEALTVGLRTAGSLGLAGPRPRLTGLARSVIAQLAALHGPSTLEIVLLSADRSREAAQRTSEWSWLGWLPHLRPQHGQDCRLLMAFDRDQAASRTAELVRRLEEESSRAPAEGGGGRERTAAADGGSAGPFTLLVVDGDPGPAEVRDAVARLAEEGPAAGVHLLCLAETPAATPSSPLSETVEAACGKSPAFRECGALALLSGAVATAVRVVLRQAPAGGPAAPLGTVGTVDAVSAAWAERFARAMAPLREPEGTAARTGTAARAAVTLPKTSRLLDELGLARATPAAVLARWAGPQQPSPGRAALVFGTGPRGPLETELTGSQPHCLITGRSGSGKTELLRSLAASLSAGERPDRLRLLLLDGDGHGDGESGGTARGDLRNCLELPHVRSHLTASDPVRMREFAQSLSGELKRRAELIGADGSYEDLALDGSRRVRRRERAAQAVPGIAGPGQVREGGPQPSSAPARQAAAAAEQGDGAHATVRLRLPQSGSPEHPGRPGGRAGGDAVPGSEDWPQAPREPQGPQELPGLEGPRAAGGTAGAAAGVPAADALAGAAVHGGTASRTRAEDAKIVQHLETSEGQLPRIVILVDDFDTLVDPALGNPGRPAAGSVVRALEAVARDGARLGVHVVAASGRPEQTAHTALARAAALHARLSWGRGDGGAGDEAVPRGRGALVQADGRTTEFQAGRVSGRIPRTSTQRPTVVPLEWERAGDPPTRRPVRELGNGPTDLALLASAVARAARSAGLEAQESGAPAPNRSRTGQDEVLES